ncbi:MAG: phospholipase C [Solirubrobacteraceae bacterium]
MGANLTRRELIGRGAALGAGAGLASLTSESLIARALAAAPTKPGHLKDIEHVVILMQENRSFDHYFGTLRGVRGFGDPKGRRAFAQAGYNGGKLLPFHLATHGSPQCMPDITHEWAAQHASWNNGRMDSFVRTHIAEDGAAAGPATMGYYKGGDIGFYTALAKAFTLCDGYHCSVLGPTDPNRLYSMSASIDPDGEAGGPLLETLVGRRGSLAGTFNWTTMPEQLSAHGVSWKVYTDPAGGVLDNVLPYFRNFQRNPALQARGLQPKYPTDFLADVASGELPHVSWVLAGLPQSEHPGFSTAKAGESVARDVVHALTSHPKVWHRTALFINWDENGGFFDHVAPPVPHPGTAGEFLTMANLPAIAKGVRGPIGLGFRVPLLIVSPFARGGFVSSTTFDHTSVLKFLERRFGAEVPNLSAWRRRTVGDLTSAFNFAARHNRVPVLPAVSLTPEQLKNGGCASPVRAYPVPRNSMPKQARGKPRRPSGLRHKPR